MIPGKGKVWKGLLPSLTEAFPDNETGDVFAMKIREFAGAHGVCATANFNRIRSPA